MEQLTNRELAVLACVADGKRNPQIAKTVHLGVYTVSRVRSRIIRKLGAQDIAHAVSIGYRGGLLKVEATR